MTRPERFGHDALFGPPPSSEDSRAVYHEHIALLQALAKKRGGSLRPRSVPPAASLAMWRPPNEDEERTRIYEGNRRAALGATTPAVGPQLLAGERPSPVLLALGSIALALASSAGTLALTGLARSERANAAVAAPAKPVNKVAPAFVELAPLALATVSRAPSLGPVTPPPPAMRRNAAPAHRVVVTRPPIEHSSEPPSRVPPTEPLAPKEGAAAPAASTPLSPLADVARSL